MTIDTRSTVKEVREHFSERMREGESTMCPCCNRVVKLYKRSITSAMAYGLILFVRKYRDTRLGYFNTRWKSPWFHMEGVLSDLGAPISIRGDMGKWIHWDCLERSEDFREDGNPDTGLYRLTSSAVGFVFNKRELRKYVKIYNKVTYGFDGPMISIVEALQNKFNYSELMSP